MNKLKKWETNGKIALYFTFTAVFIPAEYISNFRIVSRFTLYG
jgi:hypothetical protein